MTEQKRTGNSSGKIKTLANFPQMMWFMNKTDNKNTKPSETPKEQIHC